MTRYVCCYDMQAMRVRLTRKFADRIDGVNLDGYQVGEVLDLPPTEARLLLIEEWAVAERGASEHPRQIREPLLKAS